MDRRTFLGTTLAASSCLWASTTTVGAAADAPSSALKLGLVTYQWGKDMDLPTLIKVATMTRLQGIELRTEHAHHVEPMLNAAQRQEVRQRFADSPITLIGYGSNAQFHEDDPARVKHNIELAKQYIHLMHDCGGSGVKVKPNGFVPNVPHEKTIEQIGLALREVGEYGDEHGQQIRLEVHGAETCQLPVIKAIMDVADHKNVKVCWNSNKEDLAGAGLEHNFSLVKDHLGATVHVREMDLGDYPYDQLFSLFHAANYSGWILIEAHSNPDDKVAAIQAQRAIFERLTAG